MTQVILGKSRVREICMPGSVRAKAEWLSYSTNSSAQPLRSFPGRRDCMLLAQVSSRRSVHPVPPEIADQAAKTAKRKSPAVTRSFGDYEKGSRSNSRSGI